MIAGWIVGGCFALLMWALCASAGMADDAAEQRGEG